MAEHSAVAPSQRKRGEREPSGRKWQVFVHHVSPSPLPPFSEKNEKLFLLLLFPLFSNLSLVEKAKKELVRRRKGKRERRSEEN